MARIYDDILKSAEDELRRRVDDDRPWTVWSASEEVAEEVTEFIRLETALDFLNANPAVMGWLTPASDKPLWMAVREAVSAHVCQELEAVGHGILLERLGNLRNLICRLIDFSSHMAEAVPEIVPDYPGLDMAWTTDVSSTRYDDVQSVVYGALELIEVLQPLANSGFDMSTLDAPWNEEGAVVLGEMEALRVLVVNEPKAVYDSMMRTALTRMHSYGKVYSR